MACCSTLLPETLLTSAADPIISWARWRNPVLQPPGIGAHHQPHVHGTFPAAVSVART